MIDDQWRLSRQVQASQGTTWVLNDDHVETVDELVLNGSLLDHSRCLLQAEIEDLFSLLLRHMVAPPSRTVRIR
jgi:hypothetical protein